MAPSCLNTKIGRCSLTTVESGDREVLESPHDVVRDLDR
jgi:hypothetical protein